MKDMGHMHSIYSRLFGTEDNDQKQGHYIFEYESKCVAKSAQWILSRLSRERSVRIYCNSENTIQQLINFYPNSNWKALFNYNGRIAENVTLDKTYGGAQHLEGLFQEWEETLQHQGRIIYQNHLNKLSLRDIGDQLLFLMHKSKPHVLNLPPLNELSAFYNSEIQFVRQAQDKFSSRYTFIEFQNPFTKNIFKRFSYSELQEYLNDKLTTLQEHLTKWEDSDRFNQISTAWKIKASRDSLWRLILELNILISNKKVTAASIQIQSLNDETTASINQFITASPKADLDIIIQQLQEELNKLDSKIENEAWSMQRNASKEELNDLYTFLDAFQEELKTDNILKNFAVVKAAGLEFNLDILKQLIARIRASIDFLDNHKVYFQWLIFRSQLNEERLSLLHFLEKQDDMWEDVFKEIFLRNIFSQLRARLLPIDKLIDNLKELQPLIFDSILKQMLKSVDNGVVKIGLLDEAPTPYSNAYDYLFINVIPDLNKVKGVNYALFGWSATFKQELQTLGTSDPNINVGEIKKHYWRPLNGMEELNNSETTKCALYLGQEIFNAVDDIRIYELRNISIVSCLSPYKNLKIIESIGTEKVKEIMMDKNSDNLLPTILMPSAKERVLLLENGLFDLKMKTPLIHQIETINMIEAFNIHVESLYSYKTTQEQAEALIRLSDRILEMNAN